MKATACCITGCLFVWLTLPMTASWAAWCPVSSGLSVGSLAVSQVTPRDPKADRHEAERLLREARQAMNLSELEIA